MYICNSRHNGNIGRSSYKECKCTFATLATMAAMVVVAIRHVEV